MNHHARGLALIELLVAVALFGLGAVSLLRLHLELRHTTDLSRQRSEALRHAASDLEDLRWRGPTAIVDQGPAPVLSASSPTRYTVERKVDQDTAGRLHSVLTTLRWDDRHARPQSVALGTALHTLDPALGAATLLDRSAGSGSGGGSGGAPASTGERSLRIPAGARDLGDGRHGFRPRADERLVWLFDSRSAEVTGRCEAPIGLATEALTAASLGSCRALSGLLLAGHIRFATDHDSVTAADAESPTSPALPTALRLGLSTTGHPSPAWECVQDGPSHLPAPGAAPWPVSIGYHCVVQPAAPASGGPVRWSGRLDLVPLGWSLVASTGGTSGRYRICRYSADQDGNGTIDNPEHPASYSAVTTALGNQNFLVVRAAARCPLDSRPPVDDSTVQHQPG